MAQWQALNDAILKVTHLNDGGWLDDHWDPPLEWCQPEGHTLELNFERRRAPVVP